MTNSVKPPIWFWLVSVIALLWNLMGVFNYLNQAYNQEALLEAMDQAQREVFEGIPAWATAAFAIAVFAGAIGSIGLLIRKKWVNHCSLFHLWPPHYSSSIGCLSQMPLRPLGHLPMPCQ